MNFIVVGCGRVGAELAYNLYKEGHQVVVVDQNREAFNRLHPDFRGRTTEGEVLAADTLERAGIEKADGVAVVTSSDTLNAVIGHIAQVRYKVPLVVVRNYDPSLRPMLEAFGLQMVSSTAWGAQRIQELLLDAGFRAVLSAGNGEVEVYEIPVHAAWEGQTVEELTARCARQILVIAVTRAGRARFPSPEMELMRGDILTVSATLEGIQLLRACLQKNAEA